MIELTPDECRVLGVLVEKALTVPGQYPLTLNGLLAGCNQKNNRDPVTSLDEPAVLDAIAGLKRKGLAAEVFMAGSRVPKYRHTSREPLGVSVADVAVLAELLLRGPQTVGELRTRASRMVELPSTDAVGEVLRGLADRPEPLVRRVPPAPGSRAERYAQLLRPDLHPLGAGPARGAGETAAPPSDSGGLEERVAALEGEVAALRAALRRMAGALGEPDPLEAGDPPSAS